LLFASKTAKIPIVNQYQLTVIVKNDLTEEARVKLLDSLTARFDKLLKTDLWGKRNLIYPIQHLTEGYYAHYEFESDPAKIITLDKTIKSHEDIIRHLLIRV
jgi:small subunit ribosomal protein S6